MLVLSRKTGERAVIAGNIRVVVLSVHKDRVKLGFDGPAEVPIHREEVLQRIVEKTRNSAAASKHEHAGQHVRKEPGADSDVSAPPKEGRIP